METRWGPGGFETTRQAEMTGQAEMTRQADTTRQAETTQREHQRPGGQKVNNPGGKNYEAELEVSLTDGSNIYPAAQQEKKKVALG